MLMISMLLVGALCLGYIHQKYRPFRLALRLIIHAPALDHASHIPGKGRFVVHRHQLGFQLDCWPNDAVSSRSYHVAVVFYAWILLRV